IADTDNASPIVVLVVLLLFFPHSYIELPAYAVATGAGLLLIYSFFRWLFATGPRSSVRLGDALWLLALNFVIVTVMLLVAALFETTELELGGVWFLVTWVPFAVLVALALKLKGRADRMRKENRVELSADEKAGDSSSLPV
ncbi:MAG: stage II sporulation protein M, partial [Nitrososphaerales archaeon]